MRSLATILGLVAVAAAGRSARADTVVTSEGKILEGTATEADGGAAVRIGGRTLRLDNVWLWEDAQLHPVHTQGSDTTFRALRVLGARAEDAFASAELEKAVAAGAGKAARTLLQRAEHAGLDPAAAEKWQKRVMPLGEAEGTGYELPKRSGYLDVLVERAKAAFDADEESLYGMRLLHEALVRDKDYGPARDLLDFVAPERYRIGNPGTDDIGRLWLDWSLELAGEDVRLLSRRHPDMDRARGSAWGRTDLHGLETSQVVFITPMTDASAIGMCLKYADITCKVLTQIFKIDEPKRLPEDDLPLVIYFYENKDEYVKLSGRGRGFGVNPSLAMTAGHYVSSENVSRFYWPGGPDAQRQVRDTFVHELTHHWIERRNPRWHARDLKETGERVQTPGFWIVEGMAVFIEEGRYDIDSGGWSLFSPHANSMDVVVALGEKGKLIDWKRFYGMTQAGFNTDLNKDKPIGPFRQRWRPFPMQTVEIRLFYEQAASTCHYLYWGEGGRYREALKNYVTSYYTSQADQCDIQKAFGMTPEELGRRVEEYARKVIVEDWRPDGA